MPRTRPAPAIDRAWLAEQTRLARTAAGPAIWFGLASTAAAVGQTFCVARILARAMARHGGPFGWLLGTFAAFSLVRMLVSLAGERAGAAAGIRARRRLRSEVMDRLLRAGPAALRQRHSGHLAAVAVTQVDQLDGYFARYIPASVLAVASPAVVLAAIGWADPAAGGVVLAAGLLVPIGMAMAGIGAAKASRGQFVAMARLQARFLDRVRGVATIVMHGRADDEARALGVAADELRSRTMRVLRVAFLSSTVLDLAAAAALVTLAARDAAAFAGGRLADPEAALFTLLLIPEFFAPLRAYAAAYQDRFQASAAATAIADLPPAPKPADEPPLHAVRTIAAAGVAVTFEDVTFAWDKTRGPTLDALSFRVGAGETVVLAGPSGAGKSTIIELLLGFVRPDSGRILLNGADMVDIVPRAMAGLTAWIGQRPVLFAGTIRENIAFARPEASAADVEEAAAAARLSAVAATLPRGLDTPIGEGGYGLSGGQAQRVAIARAFLRNAPLLLLDEPTAHLDPATEGEVLDSLRRLTIGRTVLIASHSAAAHAFGGRRIDLRDGRTVAVKGAA